MATRSSDTFSPTPLDTEKITARNFPTLSQWSSLQSCRPSFGGIWQLGHLSLKMHPKNNLKIQPKDLQMSREQSGGASESIPSHSPGFLQGQITVYNRAAKILQNLVARFANHDPCIFDDKIEPPNLCDIFGTKRDEGESVRVSDSAEFSLSAHPRTQ